MGLALLWILLSPAAHAACDNVGLMVSAAAAEEAFGEGAPEKVRREAALMGDDLACLKEPLLPDTAAAVYRTLALAEVSRGFDAVPATAAAALRGMLAIHPDASFPADWLADGLPLHQAIALAHASDASQPAPIAAPAGVHWLIDGAPATARPTDRPVFAQCLWDTDAALKGQGWVPVGGALPACPDPPPPPHPEPKATCEGRWSRARTLDVLAAGVGSALLAGTAYAAGSVTHAAFYEEPDTYYDDSNVQNLKSLEVASNALLGSSIGLGAVGLSFGIGAGVKGCLAR